MSDPSTLPAGIERQFLPPLDIPVIGDPAIAWLSGQAIEVKVASVLRIKRSTGETVTLVGFVLDGRVMTAPADRVTRIGRLTP